MKRFIPVHRRLRVERATLRALTRHDLHPAAGADSITGPVPDNSKAVLAIAPGNPIPACTTTQAPEVA